jgi:hypothetical protein
MLLRVQEVGIYQSGKEESEKELKRPNVRVRFCVVRYAERRLGNQVWNGALSELDCSARSRRVFREPSLQILLVLQAAVVTLEEQREWAEAVGQGHLDTGCLVVRSSAAFGRLGLKQVVLEARTELA